MVLGVSYLRVLAQRPTGCCSASVCYDCFISVLQPTAMFTFEEHRAQGQDQIKDILAVSLDVSVVNITSPEGALHKFTTASILTV